MDIRESVIKRTAAQLGINENQVTLETVIPNMSCLAICVALDADIDRILKINDLNVQRTVGQAIAEFGG